MSIAVSIVRLPHARDLPLPAYETEGAAGMDVRAAVADDQPVTLGPRQRVLIPTGLIIALPSGFEAQMRPRSGLAARHGITIINAPGTIDADYRGELMVALINLGDEPFVIARGMRIAQIVIAPVSRVQWHETQKLDATERDSGGYGSTGFL